MTLEALTRGHDGLQATNQGGYVLAELIVGVEVLLFAIALGSSTLESERLSYQSLIPHLLRVNCEVVS